MHYNYPVEDKNNAAKLLLTIFIETQLNIYQKIQILSLLTLLLSTKNQLLSITIPWKLLWNDIIDILFLEQMYISLGSENLTLSYLNSAVSFILELNNIFIFIIRRHF